MAFKAEISHLIDPHQRPLPRDAAGSAKQAINKNTSGRNNKEHTEGNHEEITSVGCRVRSHAYDMEYSDFCGNGFTGYNNYQF
jgi:hypothetical protein